MRKTYITAIVIAVVLALWLASGDHDKELKQDSIAELNRAEADVAVDAAPTRVRVAVFEASEQAQMVKVRGKTTNKRTVEVKAELAGQVVERPVERGTQVAAGDLLCRISTEDREVALQEARAMLNQAKIEYQGAKRLKQKGFNSEAAIAAAQSRLATAQANLNRRQLDLEKLTVRAPFAGFVDDVHQEVGAYVTPGAGCATLVDLDPMLLTGRVSERDVVTLQRGQEATGFLSDGRTVTGPLTFIGQQSDPATRTYPIEVELANADFALRSGITTEIRVPVRYVMAQRISPALFALDDDGAIGVRIIDNNNVVQFVHVDVLADAPDGIWVTGLPNRASVIVVGQELVTAGERVDPVYQGSATLPAQSTPEVETPAGDDQTSAPAATMATAPINA